MVQAVVKPRITDSVYGKCHINLSSEDKDVLEKQPTQASDEAVEEEEPPAKKEVETTVEDSDEEEAEVAPAPVPAPAKKVVVKKAEPAPAPAPVAEEPKKVVKKVLVKK